MKKAIIKALSVVLVVVLTLTAAPLSGFVGLELPQWLDFSIKSSAATSGTCGENLIWTFDNSTGTLTISGTGTMTNYSYDNRPWENYEDNIKKVVVAKGVTTIGKYAFYSCDYLANITISDTVTSIFNSAFDECVRLEGITIPDSVTSIGNWAFFYCTRLTNINIGKSVMTVGSEAFAGCINLINITFPESISYIGTWAFAECNNLTNVYYSGTDEQWSKISIDNGNNSLLDAAIHYNCSNKVCITNTERIDFAMYDGNMGDSRLNVLGSNYEYGYGNTGLNEKTYENGFEAWIARWNYTNEISWVYATYELNSKYTYLTCSTDLIKSYNTTNFDTTVYFYDKENLLYSVNLTDDNYIFSFIVNVEGVDELTIKVMDNVAVSGGTSFALYDMFLYGENEENVNIGIYSSSPNLCVGTEQEIRFALSLYKNDTHIESNQGYSIVIDDNSCLKLIDSYITGKDHIVIFEGKKEGNTNITFIEYETKVQKCINVSVEKNSNYYRCMAADQSDALWIGGVCIADFTCTENSTEKNISFNAYNTDYSYATAEVFDSNGKLLKSVALSPKTDDSGMEKVINSFKYVYVDLTDHTTPWYKKNGNSECTPVFLENLPLNSVIKITCDGTKSDLVTLYNAVDVFVNVVMFASGIDISKEAHKASVSALIKNSIESLSESALNSLASELSTSMLNGATKDAASSTYEIIYNMFSKMGIDYKNILINVLKGMGYSALDSIVTTLIPAWQIVTAVDDVSAIAWTILSYSSFEYDTGELKIYVLNHYLENVLIENAVSVSQESAFSNTTILDAYVVEESEKQNKFPDTYIGDIVYNITLRDSGIETQPKDVIEVRIPVPDGMDGRRCMVYRYETDGSKTVMPTYLDDGYLVFITDHLSYYLVSENYNHCFSIQTPSRTEIRHKDGIKLHTNIEGTTPAGSYVEWTASNGKFKTEEINNGTSLKIVSNSNGKTIFTATLYSADGEVLATDTIEMKSKAGFFDKIGSFFRSLFGATKIYEY